MRLQDSNLPFAKHFDELRGRLISCLSAVLAGAGVFYAFLDNVMAFLIRPVGKIVFTFPSEVFVTRMALTLLGGCALALPVIFYHVWSFVSLGMTVDERKYVRLYGVLSFFSFVLGSLFAYFVLIPVSIQFFLSFSSDTIVPMITLSKYVSFVGTMVMAGGILFEMPLILVFLTRIGIATPDFLIHYRRHVIVLIFVVSAVVTPPDVFTQFLMAVPLVILYEAGILLSKVVYNSRSRVAVE